MQLAGKSLQTADWGLVQFRHCASLERLSQGQEIATPPGANQWRGKCSDFKQTEQVNGSTDDQKSKAFH